MLNIYYPNLVYIECGSILMAVSFKGQLVACFHECSKKKCQLWQEIKSIKWVKKKLEKLIM